ncbi:hypothetical protein E1091_14210 [Micromonospora fluostatini]|uniref:Uncharacterized protein n=1 Tax=Micromonospora fluostatini TaxID=1629071 RepID=A0ABY2DEM9_9ACTN|nr:hypothetical protein E1091_14210 [Micromonospora fluostatini]
MRAMVIAYGAGIATGALVTWEAARRWERAAWAWSWAAGWLGEAMWLAREAAGWIVVVLVVLGGAGALVWLAL